MTPPPEDNVTLGILGERLNNVVTLLHEVRDTQKEHGEEIKGLPGLSARVDAMERWQTWALRTVIGLVLVAGVTGAMAYLPGLG